ncbi:hypothetical protein [Hymenobacter crusticola]|nr:hypothetical protein [Hymenobacter crusticola]
MQRILVFAGSRLTYLGRLFLQLLVPPMLAYLLKKEFQPLIK